MERYEFKIFQVTGCFFKGKDTITIEVFLNDFPMWQIGTIPYVIEDCQTVL